MGYFYTLYSSSDFRIFNDVLGDPLLLPDGAVGALRFGLSVLAMLALPPGAAPSTSLSQ